MEPDKMQVKISGYLDKKTKKKMISTYKKYWFVLEGRLLLYYCSKDEYEAISPCRGSITLGPPCAVKPCPSSNTSSFQIETRYNTITLRAIDRDDQNRWMQALMTVLNQNQSISKLCHFRYSMDSGINSEKTPKRQSSLINRLQTLGGQSYGGSLSSISRIANTLGGNKTKSIDGKLGEVKGYFNEDDYSVIKSSSSGSVEFRRLENEHLYDTLNDECIYSVPNKGNSTRTTLVVDNEHYCGVDETITFPNTDSEVIYTEPQCSEMIDVNRNTLIIENPTYTTVESGRKSKSPTNSLIVENEEYIKVGGGDYEVIEDVKVGGEKQTKRFQSFRNKLKFKESKENGSKMKKSESFIKRVWRRRKSAKAVDDGNIYETIVDTDVEKIELGNDGTVQMLNELQNLLEKKKPMLLQQMRKSSEEIPVEEMPEVPPKIVRKPETPPPDKSLDEILTDLEQQSGKEKMKKLIKKFSGELDDFIPDDEVILRKTTKTNPENRFSDELTRLLNDLAKVTCAPLMTPGATMSLVNPNLTDEQLLELVPIRRRRYSEPDYDIPRPHRLTKEGNSSIPCVKFFGPLEKSNSFAPDSLEPNVELATVRIVAKGDFNSDTMQIKEKNRSCDECTIYSRPKSVNNDEVIYENVVYKSIEEKDLFVDSLEVTTPF